MDVTTDHAAGLGSGGLDALVSTPNMEVIALLMLVLAWLVVIIPTIGMVASVDQAPRRRHCSQCGAGPDTGYPSTAAHERPDGARTCRHCHNPAEVFVIQNKDGANPLPLFIAPEWSPIMNTCEERGCAAEIARYHDERNSARAALDRCEDAIDMAEAGGDLDERVAELSDTVQRLDEENGRLRAEAASPSSVISLDRLTSTIKAVLTLKLNRVDLLDSDVEVWLALAQMCEDLERGAGL